MNRFLVPSLLQRRQQPGFIPFSLDFLLRLGTHEKAVGFPGFLKFCVIFCSLAYFECWACLEAKKPDIFKKKKK